MTYQQFLTKVIDEGIAAATKDYTRPDQKDKLRGSVAGFEACRNKMPPELKELLETCAIATRDAHDHQQDKYWWYVCYESEVRWTCNVASAMLISQGWRPIIIPTARGVIKSLAIFKNGE